MSSEELEELGRKAILFLAGLFMLAVSLFIGYIMSERQYAGEIRWLRGLVESLDEEGVSLRTQLLKMSAECKTPAAAPPAEEDMTPPADEKPGEEAAESAVGAFPAQPPAAKSAARKDRSEAGRAADGMDNAALAAHNAARGEKLPRLRWSPAAAYRASQKAVAIAGAGCSMPSALESGYNVYLRNDAVPFSPQRAVDLWAGGQTAADAESHVNVMSADTVSVGCGMAICPSGGQVMACNYTRRGK